uniref:Uncharacterized protein n=1 Tax=Meloidogyne enterolobii TaxID=390850 RepID=A0A6V7WA32_MELEN|nr:unnamed protein product [Meloidogyne enterolobii]
MEFLVKINSEIFSKLKKNIPDLTNFLNPNSILNIFHRCSLFNKIPERCFYPSIQDCLTSCYSLNFNENKC